MRVKERQICKKERKKERKTESSPRLLASNLLNCVLSCWDFQLHLFTNLRGRSLLSGRVRKSALTCCAALRAALNAASPCRQTKGRQKATDNSTICSSGSPSHYSLSLSASPSDSAIAPQRLQHELILNHIQKNGKQYLSSGKIPLMYGTTDAHLWWKCISIFKKHPDHPSYKYCINGRLKGKHTPPGFKVKVYILHKHKKKSSFWKQRDSDSTWWKCQLRGERARQNGIIR